MNPGRPLPQPTPGAERGLTLVELLCVLAITAVLLGGAWPMFLDMHARQALQSQAALLETDVHFARSQALTNGRAVRLSVQAMANGATCYVVHTGPAHACRCSGGGQAVCDVDTHLLRLAEQGGPSSIALGPVQRSVLFDPGQGTVTPTATLRLTDARGRAIHQIINIMGRVRSCTPTAGLGGLRPC